MKAILIKGGRLVDPASGICDLRDVLIKDGKVAAISPVIDICPEKADYPIQVVDARGMLVTPGLIDLHVHLREPGYEHKEDIESGARAAAAGGFTTIVAMPNTSPVVDNASMVGYIKGRAKAVSPVSVEVAGAITKGQKGEELAHMGEMALAGAVAFTDDGYGVTKSEVMRAALDYSRAFGLPIMSHCEDQSLSQDGVMNQGMVSWRLGLRGIPAEAEEIMVARDLMLAGLTGGRLHICHVSTAGSVDLLREAKRRGVSVTAEVSPHHLAFTEDLVAELQYDASAKVNPPLRTARDREALLEGLADGTIDAIATDHAPHHPDEKQVEFEYAPFGITGLETALGLVWTFAVLPGHIEPSRAVACMSLNPARILGLTGGLVQEGANADITVIDVTDSYTVDAATFTSKGKVSPAQGRTLTGRAYATIKGGQIIWGPGRQEADS